MDLEEAFLEEVKSGDLAKVKRSLEAAPRLIDAKNASGISAILLAAYHGHPPLVDFLLSQNPQLDIFEAATVGKEERVAELTGSDPASINGLSPDGFSPLHLAAFFGRPEVVAYLIDRGAEVNSLSKNPMRVLPLHSALAHRRADVVLKMAEILLISRRGGECGASRRLDAAPSGGDPSNDRSGSAPSRLWRRRRCDGRKREDARRHGGPERK